VNLCENPRMRISSAVPVASQVECPPRYAR
jgi:hypothetical protein